MHVQPFMDGCLNSLQTLQLIKEINLRSAKRLLDGCLANGGLYIKIGQGVSAINHILPPEYTNTLKQLEVTNNTHQFYISSHTITRASHMIDDM